MFAAQHHEAATPLSQSNQMSTSLHIGTSQTGSRSNATNIEAGETARLVQPTWYGFVECTVDALKLIEACVTLKLRRIQRRPDENERPHIIQCGAVFVFDETTTGILRWTDDRNWSPSRVRGNFMLYRELDDKVLPGGKKRAIKKQKSSSGESGALARSVGDKSRREDESSVRGSHMDSYAYKQDGGLMKRTFSAYYGDTKWSVISYYDPNRVDAGLLQRVSGDPMLKDIQPRSELKGKTLQSSRPSTPTTSQGLETTNEWTHQMGSYEFPYGSNQQLASQYTMPPGSVLGQVPYPTMSSVQPHDGTYGSPYPGPGYNPSTSFPMQQQQLPAYSSHQGESFGTHFQHPNSAAQYQTHALHPPPEQGQIVGNQTHPGVQYKVKYLSQGQGQAFPQIQRQPQVTQGLLQERPSDLPMHYSHSQGVQPQHPANYPHPDGFPRT